MLPSTPNPGIHLDLAAMATQGWGICFGTQTQGPMGGPFIYLYCRYESMVTATSMIGSMIGLMIGIAPYENSMIGSISFSL